MRSRDIILAIVVLTLSTIFMSVSHAINMKPVKQVGKWQKSSRTVLNAKGFIVSDPNICERFEVEVADNSLQFKLRCGRHFSSGLIPLGEDDKYGTYHVERDAKKITVSKIGYYGQKIQTGKASQKLVKMPFVEEVIHVHFMQDGSLSYYKEEFVVDDFGRVIQKNFFQAFGMTDRVRNQVSKN